MIGMLKILPALLCILLLTGCFRPAIFPSDVDPGDQEAEIEVEEGVLIDEKDTSALLKTEAIMEIEPTAYGINVSPANDYLIYRLPGAPADGVRILNLETGEKKSIEVPGPMSVPQKGSVAFSPDGEKMAYSLYSYEEQNEVICFSTARVPPQIYHTVSLNSEEMLEDVHPVWKADQESIYYIAAEGLMEYRFMEEITAEQLSSLSELSGRRYGPPGPLFSGTTKQLCSISEMPGLVSETALHRRVAPLAYSMQPGQEKMAYFYDGNIRVVDLERGKAGEPIKVGEVGRMQSIKMKFSHDGKYLALMCPSYPADAHNEGFLLLFDLSTGEMLKLMTNPRSFSWSPQEEVLAVLAIRDDKMWLALYDTMFRPIHQAEVPQYGEKAVSVNEVLWLRGEVVLLIDEDYDHGTLYKITFEQAGKYGGRHEE